MIAIDNSTWRKVEQLDGAAEFRVRELRRVALAPIEQTIVSNALALR